MASSGNTARAAVMPEVARIASKITWNPRLDAATA